MASQEATIPAGEEGEETLISTEEVQDAQPVETWGIDSDNETQRVRSRSPRRPSSSKDAGCGAPTWPRKPGKWPTGPPVVGQLLPGGPVRPPPVPDRILVKEDLWDYWRHGFEAALDVYSGRLS